MWLKRFLIIWICWAGVVCPSGTMAQKTVQYDTSHPRVRHFDKKAVEQYASQKEFSYTENAPRKGLSLWDRFWRWVWDKLDAGLSSGGGNLFLLILGLVALVFLVMKLSGMDALKMLSRSPAEAGLEYSEEESTIHGVNFDAEIAKAAAAGDYRLAVRMLYLKCLKRLSDSGKIDWQPDKTNRTYARELKDGRQEQFLGLTRQFEYVWYGNFPVSEEDYADISKDFSAFNR